MNITGSTKIVGIFGDPVAHTLSPAMQNAAFGKLGLDMVYIPFHVRADNKNELKKAVEGIRAMDFAGVNITIPHKENVIALLDEVDDYAAEIGAVNTIVNEDGKLQGYNTDGLGYLKSLREETGFYAKGKTALVLGAGGAARAIVYALLKSGASEVLISNRTEERAKELEKDFRKSFGRSINTISFEADALKEAAANTELLVNTTSLGMMGKGELVFPLESLPEGAVVSDIVYRPLVTELLKNAKRLRLKTHGGLGMLIHQGAIGFELWTGKRAPVEVMRRAALKALKDR